MPKNAEVIPPLVLTQRFTNSYPEIWDRIDELRSRTVSGEIPVPWDFDLCYCPVAVAMGALESYQGIRARVNGEAGVIAACAAWRRSKMIYRFNSALGDELVSMADDITVPVEILRSLPAPAVYVQFEEPGGDREIRIDGFLVHVEDDVNTREKELRIDYLTTDGTPVLPIFVHLIPGGTVSDGIRKAEEMARENLRNNPLVSSEQREASLRTIRESTQIAKEALQLILYLCSENAEIREDEAQAKIYRKSDRIVDKFRELRKWDVGVKTGIILRAAEKRDRGNSQTDSAQETRETTGSFNRIHKSRPHVRRAHWHHFWTGSGDNKKLILRWVSTILVNADEGELPPVVIPLT